MFVPDPETSGEETKVRTQISSALRYPLESSMTKASPTRSSPRRLLILDQPRLQKSSILNPSRLHHKHTYLRARACDGPLSLEHKVRLYTITFSFTTNYENHEMKPRSKTLPKLTNDQYKIMDGTDSWGAFLNSVRFAFTTVYIKSGGSRRIYVYLEICAVSWAGGRVFCANQCVTSCLCISRLGLLRLAWALFLVVVEVVVVIWLLGCGDVCAGLVDSDNWLVILAWITGWFFGV